MRIDVHRCASANIGAWPTLKITHPWPLPATILQPNMGQNNMITTLFSEFEWRIEKNGTCLPKFCLQVWKANFFSESSLTFEEKRKVVDAYLELFIKTISNLTHQSLSLLPAGPTDAANMNKSPIKWKLTVSDEHCDTAFSQFVFVFVSPFFFWSYILKQKQCLIWHQSSFF